MISKSSSSDDLNVDHPLEDEIHGDNHRLGEGRLVPQLLEVLSRCLCPDLELRLGTVDPKDVEMLRLDIILILSR